jgi:hypothetical protein
VPRHASRCISAATSKAVWAAYVAVNLFLVLVWALSGGGYSWPGRVMAAWGVGLALGLWDYFRGPITEADIDKELRRRR